MPAAHDTDVLLLMPQRQPMVMVDRLMSVDDTAAHTELLVREDNLFVRAGCLSTPGLLEHLAQSAAVMEGWHCRLNQRPVEMKYLCEIKNFTVRHLPKVGSLLQSTIEIKAHAGGILMVKCTTREDQEVIATGILKIQQ